MTATATPHEGPTTGEPAPIEFQQKLGLFDATMLVTGSMIGSGIFIVSADIARDVGSTGWFLFVWLLTGVMTIAGALSYAELAAMMPQAGGQYVYLREAFSPPVAFAYGWVLLLVTQSGGMAAVAVTLARYLGQLLGVSLPEAAVAVVTLAALTAVNCRGVRAGSDVQAALMVLKTLAAMVAGFSTVSASSRTAGRPSPPRSLERRSGRSSSDPRLRAPRNRRRPCCGSSAPSGGPKRRKSLARERRHCPRRALMCPRRCRPKS